MYGRGQKKLIRDRSITTTPTPGLEINARPTTEDNLNVITVVDQSGNTDLIKTENIEQTDNQNEQNPINRYGNPNTLLILQVTPLTNGANTTANRKAKTQRPEDMEKKNPEREEEEDFTVETVFKTFINIRTIRCYYYRFNFEFITVILIHSCYVCTCSYFLKKGECGMSSHHAILYMYTKTSSSDNLVPVNNVTTQYCADLLINF